MGKKKNKYWQHGSKKSKKNKHKRIKGTGSKKYLKKVAKELERQVTFPALEEARATYNLRKKSGEIRFQTLAEFKQENQDKMYLMPNLPELVELVGENNLGINDKVYVPIALDNAVIDTEAVEKALLTMQLAVNTIITSTDDEKKISAVRDRGAKFDKYGRMLIKLFKEAIEKVDVNFAVSNDGDKFWQ